jgi:hypothetical protein
MSIGLILLVVLVLLCVGGLPHWPYSSGWGYGPSGFTGILFVLVILYLLFGVHRA